MTRQDVLMTDPRLVEIVQGESLRLAKTLRLDVVDSKEVYRSMIFACISVVIAIDEAANAS